VRVLLDVFPQPPSSHSVLDTLRDHLGVVWGALVAFVVVVLLTPAVGGMARLLGVVDRPEGRRINRRAVPRLGGLALFLGIFVPALAFLNVGRETRGLLLGAAVAVTVGAVDDFRGLAWWQKLAGQLASASIPAGFGIWVDRFTFPFLGIHSLPSWVGIPLTVIWIVAIMNMVNFLDGLDGLAAGVAAIAGGTFCVIALSLGKSEPAILSAIVLGASIGFLRHNFYPARIFMGDSGALLLGYVLAAVAVQGLLKTAATVALFFPLLVLAVPIIDTSFVVARRLKHGERVFEADQAHLHHRFLRRGFTQRTAALYMYAWCLTLAAAALATRFIPFRAHGVWHLWPTVAAAAIGLLALGMSIYTVYLLEIVKLSTRRRRFAAGARSAAEPLVPSRGPSASAETPSERSRRRRTAS
jgi:UDP-GlcNAc:undecaprenyl-phosphate GlcNAc-1-phosphate transferase